MLQANYCTGLKPLTVMMYMNIVVKKHEMDLSSLTLLVATEDKKSTAKEITKTREDLYLDGRLGLTLTEQVKIYQSIATKIPTK